ncbi:MAG: glycine cleavage system aminomethyltransferase GcvT [Dehalococcoidia bacterium]
MPRYAMPEDLKHTPLHPSHQALDAHMIPFAGWEMPARYASAVQEHHAVRTGAGVFDVSHMGRLYLKGPDARVLLDRVVTANLQALDIAHARYCMACQEDGGIIDDLIVYCLDTESYLVVCNAANRKAVISILREQAHQFSKVSIDDQTTQTAMIALQGPRALDKLKSIADLDTSSLPLFTCDYLEVLGEKTLIARTGYTGEDGVELIVAAQGAIQLWQALLDADATPCGLVARDSLRLEAALRLWGNDMDTTVNPYEAGLGRFVVLDKAPYTGKEALLRAKREGVERRLIGFDMVERGIPRHGFTILSDGEAIGEVTSGGYSPTLSKGLGLGYVPASKAARDTPLAIDIRGRQVAAKVVSLPFYRRPRP